jgi:chromosome partitioning protein
LAEVVQSSGRSLLDVVSSGPDTVFLEAEIGKAMFREQLLSRALKGVRYDFTVVDCPPGWPDVSINALVAADSIIIPVTLAKFGLDGLRAMMDAYQDFRENGHTRAKIVAVIPTFFDQVTADTQVQYNKLIEMFDPARITAPVPRDTKAKSAPDRGQTLFEYAPNAPAIAGYLKNSQRVGGYGAAFDAITKRLMQEMA